MITTAAQRKSLFSYKGNQICVPCRNEAFNEKKNVFSRRCSKCKIKCCPHLCPAGELAVCWKCQRKDAAKAPAVQP